MNETIVNETLSWNSFTNDFVRELSTGMNITESIIFIIIYLALAILTYKIFTNTNKINKEIKFESVNYFSKSFKFYFIYFILTGLLEIITITSAFISINSNLLVITIIMGLILILLIPWVARTYLFESMLYKYFEKDLPSKFSRKIFFFFIAFLIGIDFVFYAISLIISPYLFIVYTLLVLGLFLYYIYKKEGDLKKITKQIPHLTIILLLFLRLTNIYDFFVEDDKLLTYFEYFNAILTFIIYSFILIRLKKWRKVLTN